MGAFAPWKLANATDEGLSPESWLLNHSLGVTDYLLDMLYTRQCLVHSAPNRVSDESHRDYHRAARLTWIPGPVDGGHLLLQAMGQSFHGLETQNLEEHGRRAG